MMIRDDRAAAQRPEDEELARCRQELSQICDVALLSSLANVTYVSGFEVPLPVGVPGAVPYAGPFAVIGVETQGAALAVSAFDEVVAAQQSRLDRLLTFAAFDTFRYQDPKATYLEALRLALLESGLKAGHRVGVEASVLPYGAAELLTTEFPRTKIVDIEPALRRARSIKTRREISLLRAAAHVGDVGQQTLAQLVKHAGRTEAALYSEVMAAMFEAAGHQIPVAGELVSGPRTSTVNYPGGPIPRVMEMGDAVIMDISQRIGGYWSDCTNTHLVGKQRPNDKQQRFVRASQAAFSAAARALKPGALARDVWNAGLAEYTAEGLEPPHYLGHQIGVAVNELPRLVPYDDSEIRPGMVFAVEPGAYEGVGGKFGIRSEKMILVTEQGPEILSEFDWGLELD